VDPARVLCIEPVERRRRIFDEPQYAPRVPMHGGGSMMILFGGGDGGGIVIDATGIHRIPPYSPDVLLQLKAASALVAVNALHTGKLAGDTTAIAEQLTTAVIPQITKTAGATNLGDNSIACVDDDGGFVCGSTGKRPIPIPRKTLTSNQFSPVTQHQAVHA